MAESANNQLVGSPKRSVISLNRLSLILNLGVTDNERRVPQEVWIDYKIYFSGIPNACESDKVSDTICYHEIAEITKNYCKNKEFRLLESLCYQLYQQIRGHIDAKVGLWVRVKKCKPPIDDLLGTTSFELADNDL